MNSMQYSSVCHGVSMDDDGEWMCGGCIGTRRALAGLL